MSRSRKKTRAAFLVFCLLAIWVAILPLVTEAQQPPPESQQQPQQHQEAGPQPGLSPPQSPPAKQPAAKNEEVKPRQAVPPDQTVAKGVKSKSVEPAIDTAAQSADEGVALIVAGDEVLRLKATISGFTPDQRVAAILARIAKLEQDPNFVPESITTQDTGFSTDVIAGPYTILTVTDRDARMVGSKDRAELALESARKLRHALIKLKEAHSPKVIICAGLLTVAASLVLFLILIGSSALFPRVYDQIRLLRGRYIKSLKIQQSELLSEESLTDILIGIIRLVRALITTAILAVYIAVVMSFFPTTRDLSAQFVDQSVVPILNYLGLQIANLVPNLLIIAAITAVTYYLLTFINFIFFEIGRGRITISDFDPEWADPTYKIARFLIIAFAVVLIFPYLPGSGSPAFQQISIFLGVLFSLGSSGAIANVVAGVFLTYTGAFKIGDRVKIADTIGDVVQKKLLYTRVRTIKNEYITVPNSLVLGSHIVNYSSSTSETMLILHTSVTISYDVDWRKVQGLLIEAALATDNVLKEPAPFVFVTELNAFYVTYEINAHTTLPNAMARTYADLRKCILDKFNQAGVEIATPDQTALRNSDKPAIPVEFLPEGAAESFSVSIKSS